MNTFRYIAQATHYKIKACKSSIYKTGKNKFQSIQHRNHCAKLKKKLISGGKSSGQDSNSFGIKQAERSTPIYFGETHQGLAPRNTDFDGMFKVKVEIKLYESIF